jgi:hypothetical protein
MKLSIMQSILVLSVSYAVCQIHTLHAECHYAECRYAECRYAECHYGECRHAECRGATQTAPIETCYITLFITVFQISLSSFSLRL